ncbi:MAG TPA: chloride channel protein [Herpetosiphonaceae bacterium]|nr:chloride channel protein [Herpetosiphonaceae bacterium]
MSSEHSRRPAASRQHGAEFRLLTVSILAGLIGTLAGFVAYGLLALIGLVSNAFFFGRVGFELPNLQEHQLGLWVIGLPVAGGLVIGLMAKYGSSKIRGHGIPEAMEAVLENRSRISPRVAILKPISVAIAIGTGGPFGAEGPIIQTGGALGSLIGQILRTTAAERKVLLACGAAAGMAAIFSTPIAAVILAIELLLFEFKSRSFIPLVIASTLATTMHFQLMGREPLFAFAPVDFGIPAGLPFYLLLGALAGLLAVGLSKSLYWVEDQFERLPFDPMWWPALGGLGLGVIGFFVPRVLGVGYETINDIINGRLALGVLAVVMVAKLLALLVSLGSGTSGGLLAPTFMISAAMGAAFAELMNRLIPGLNLAPGAYALVAMAAVFGAASRATFAFIIFAFETTRDYNAILPLMLTGVIASGIARVFMEHSIMTEKLARRGLRVHQEYEADIFQQVKVGEVMDAAPATIQAELTIAELAGQIARHHPGLTRHQAIPIVGAAGQPRGMITRKDLVRALQEDPSGQMPVIEAGSQALVLAYADDSLHDATLTMARHQVGRLLVVERSEPDRLAGYLGRNELINARLRRLDDEHVREPGWLGRRAEA